MFLLPKIKCKIVWKSQNLKKGSVLTHHPSDAQHIYFITYTTLFGQREKIFKWTKIPSAKSHTEKIEFKRKNEMKIKKKVRFLIMQVIDHAVNSHGNISTLKNSAHDEVILWSHRVSVSAKNKAYKIRSSQRKSVPMSLHLLLLKNACNTIFNVQFNKQVVYLVKHS